MYIYVYANIQCARYISNDMNIRKSVSDKNCISWRGTYDTLMCLILTVQFLNADFGFSLRNRKADSWTFSKHYKLVFFTSYSIVIL
jgi:hypothetical protein